MDPIITSSGDLIADRRFEFGRDLALRRDYAAAADLFAQAVDAAPSFAPAWLALGEARLKLGNASGAAAALRRAIDLDPQDQLGAALRLARCGDGNRLPTMPAGYVQALFDRYAPEFDAALARLGYRGPDHLREAVSRARPAQGFEHVLDLGCGTGLAGSAFRPSARRLTGVDLSPAMIEIARSKNIYDRLETGDVLAHLHANDGRGESYDLVIAADVFVYLPDLVPVAAAVARVLSARGLFAFTVECGDCGVELGETLRYRHGADHVNDAVAAAGLAIAEISPALMRREAGEDVQGLVVVAAKPSAPESGAPAG